MNLYLQMGHGMREHCVELNKKWKGATSILSPKNMTIEKMLNLSDSLEKYNGSVIFDPQFYVPRTSHENLCEHSFWPSNYNTNMFLNGSGCSEMLNVLYNDYVLPLKANAFIIPGIYFSNVDGDFDKINSIIQNAVNKMNIKIPKYMTLCIGEDLLKNEEKTHALLDYLENYPVDGFYIVPIHPNNSYLIDNASWLINLFDLVAGLKLFEKTVIVGYSNHQFLFLSLAKVDAICAGTWMKTRMFPLGDFKIDDDEQEGGRKSTWYYCPQALTEYQIQFLDIAHSGGILKDMKTDPVFNSNYTDILFQGAQPTTVNFSEREAFRHYLQCLKVQCDNVSGLTYEETKKYLSMIFDAAIDLTTYFRSNGVRGKHKDFNNVGDTTLSIVDAFENIRGLVFKNLWDNI